MAIDFEMESIRAKGSGMNVAESFDGVIRSNATTTFAVGDTFTIDPEFKVFKRQIPGSKDADGNPIVAQNTLVEVTSTTGVTDNRALYPKVFSRNLYPVEKQADGTYLRTGVRIAPSGDVVDLYKKHANIQDGMKAIAGRKIRVTKVTPVEVLRYGSDTEMERAQVYQFDFVD